jgi:hypothetical protein
MIGYAQISKKDFYRSGGLSNPRNVRITRGHSWVYLRRI